jgi:hypothetical protein
MRSPAAEADRGQMIWISEGCKSSGTNSAACALCRSTDALTVSGLREATAKARALTGLITGMAITKLMFS